MQGSAAISGIPVGVPARFYCSAGEARDAADEARYRESRDSDGVRVMIVDDHMILRTGLVHLLSAEEGIHIVAEAGDGEQAVELARRHRPDVITMDVTMPGMSGIDATRQIRREFPEIRIIGLSMHVSRDMAQQMRDAGAERYLAKDGPLEELAEAIRGSRQ